MRAIPAYSIVFLINPMATAVEDSPRAAVGPVLRIATEGAAEGLSVPSGKPARLVLAAPDSKSWDQYNVGTFKVRGPERQVSIVPLASRAQGTEFEYTFPVPGAYLLALSIGPIEGKNQSDSWQRVTYCSKVCVFAEAEGESSDHGDRRPVDPGLTAKIGQKYEIVPLVSPLEVRVGWDFPVRAFADFDKLTGGEIQALRPDGTIDIQTTDAVGAATFRISQAGRWIIRFERPCDQTTCVAELVFAVPSAGGGPKP